MKILVVGGSGFIGRNFLLSGDISHTYYATFNTSDNFINFITENNLSNVVPIHIHLADKSKTLETFAKLNQKFDVCLYAVGNSDIGASIRNPRFDIENNVLLLLNTLESIQVKKFVFISSGSVYEGYQGLVNPSLPVSPTVPYSVSKLTSERYIEFYQKCTTHIENFISLRFFGAYGRYELPRKIYTNLVKAFCFEQKSVFTMNGNGLNYIDAMYVDDMVDGLFKIIKSDKSNKILDFCCGSPLTINELVYEAASAFGIDTKIIHQGDTPEYTTFYASPNEMKSLFNFAPTTSLNTGLKKFANFLGDN